MIAVFIGDSAPLSFLQTVRHLITSHVDPNALTTGGARDSVIEHMSGPLIARIKDVDLKVDPQLMRSAVDIYLTGVRRHSLKV